MASWYPGDPANSVEAPSYPTVPTIAVYDSVRPVLTGRERRMWTRARARSLTAWEAAGLEFTPFPSAERYNAGAITLSLDESIERAGMGGYTSLHQAGFALFKPSSLENIFAERWRGYLRYLIGHEFGHALGFHHGGHGIMGTASTEPKAEELAAARAYYLGV